MDVKAILVARLYVLRSVIHVSSQDTNSAEDCMTEQSPSHSAGMLRSKVGSSNSLQYLVES